MAHMLNAVLVLAALSILFSGSGIAFASSPALRFSGTNSTGFFFGNITNINSWYGFWARPPHNYTFVDGESAKLVIGQQNFVEGLRSPISANTLNQDHVVAFDSRGDLWVADTFNNRVLEFSPPFTIGESASLVIGQHNFTASGNFSTTANSLSGARGIAFDSRGDLWVADSVDNRILEYNAPLRDGEAASLVIGQNSLTGKNKGASSNTLGFPRIIAFDSSGNLWVTDQQNNRVLEFMPPFTTGESASLVIGQPDFARNSNGSSSNTLNSPEGLAFDSSGDLWISDYANNRILEYDAPLHDGESASLVLGQENFVSNGCGTSSSALCTPTGLAFDSRGDLWEGEYDNNRVLEFAPPFTTGESASLVIGQANFTSNSDFPIKADSLYNPRTVAFDSSGDLWVADRSHSRVLEYIVNQTAGSVPSSGYGSGPLSASGADIVVVAEAAIAIIAVVVLVLGKVNRKVRRNRSRKP